jgi:hypothetical protein
VSVLATLSDGVSNVATAVCIGQTTPPLAKDRARVLRCRAARYQGGRSVWSTNEAMGAAERELALQAQRAYKRTVSDWQAQMWAPPE